MFSVVVGTFGKKQNFIFLFSYLVNQKISHSIEKIFIYSFLSSLPSGSKDARAFLSLVRLLKATQKTHLSSLEGWDGAEAEKESNCNIAHTSFGHSSLFLAFFPPLFDWNAFLSLEWAIKRVEVFYVSAPLFKQSLQSCLNHVSLSLLSSIFLF